MPSHLTFRAQLYAVNREIEYYKAALASLKPESPQYEWYLGHCTWKISVDLEQKKRNLTVLAMAARLRGEE